MAEQVRDVERSQRVLGRALLVTYPLLLAVLAVIAWWMIGRTLRPGRGPARRCGADQRHRPGRTAAGARHRRRDPRPGGDPQRHARPAGQLAGAAAGLRGRRRARAAQPAGVDAHPAGGGAATRRGRRPAGGPARRRAAAVPHGRGPAAAGPGRRRRAGAVATGVLRRPAPARRRGRPVRRRTGPGPASPTAPGCSCPPTARSCDACCPTSSTTGSGTPRREVVLAARGQRRARPC